MLIQKFDLTVINNERKTLTQHEVIDRIVKKIGVCVKRTKIADSSELTTAKFCIYLFI